MPHIEHVVVLMLENRSFDHMLGFLDLPGLNPLTDADAIPADPDNTAAGTVAPFRLTSYNDVSHDPGHGYPDVMEQLTGTTGPWTPFTPTNDGFVRNFGGRAGVDHASEIMGCYDDGLLPVTWTLAREFAVCSRWFCSLPSETWPNRLFAHAATSDGTVHNEIRLYDNRTIFNAIEDAGHDWRVYAGDIPQVAAFSHLLWHPFKDRFDRLHEFFNDARKNRLPTYSFIEPRHFGGGANSEHPRQRVSRGEKLIKDVYEAIAGNGKTWNSTLLLITYDEHGGFFDREAPDAAPSPKAGLADDQYGFQFDLLGPRVPALAISAYIEPATVSDTQFDHTSIIRTLRDLFGVEKPLTDRDAAANTLLPLLTREEPRRPAAVPVVDEGISPDVEALDVGVWAEGRTDDGTIRLNDLQQSLMQLKQMLDEEKGEAGPVVSATRPLRVPGDLEAIVADFQFRHIDPS